MNAKVAMMSKEDTVKAKRRKHASGEGLKDDHKPGVDRVFFHRDWLSQYDLDPKMCSIISVDGRGMEPILEDKGMAMVDHQRTKLIDGHIFVVRIDEVYVIGRAEKSGKKWRLTKDSGSEDIDLPPGAEVFGQVVWTGKTLLREDQDQFVSIPHYTWEGYEKKVMNEAKLTSKGE